MSISTTLTHSLEAWKYLRGLVCLYKPPNYSQKSLLFQLKHKVSQDLNLMERTVEQSDTELIEANSDNSEDNNLILRTDTMDVMTTGDITDYSTHPLVLGPGYHPTDFQQSRINNLSDRVSGISLVAINESGRQMAKTLIKANLLKTYHIRGEFGRATRTGWADGKTVMCQGYKHVQSRPWLLDQMLVNITSSHQARAWQVAEVGLETEDAYQLACQGPVRPKLLSEMIIYNLAIKELKMPHFLLEVQCVDMNQDDQQSLVTLVQEIAIKCKTVCHVTSIRCAALGPWNTDHALLHKHLSLQNVLNNISENRRLYKEFIAKPCTLFTPTIKEKRSREKPPKKPRENTNQDDLYTIDTRHLETF